MSLSYINRVPAEPFVRLIRDYLNTQVDLSEMCLDERFPAPFTLLAEKIDIDPHTLRSYVRTDRNVHTLNFNLADRILCALHKTEMWRGELFDIYESVVLVDDEDTPIPSRPSGSKVCERHGCSEMFVPAYPWMKFCSSTCRSTAWKHKNTETKTRKRGPGRKLEALWCVNGHERTKENTAHDIRGRLVCRVCKNEQSKAWRKRNQRAA